MPDSQDSNPPLPAPPCLASPDVHARLESMEATLHEIRTALIGNPKLGHRGLVCRVKDVEQIVQQHDRKLIAWGAGITVLLAAFSALKDYIIGK